MNNEIQQIAQVERSKLENYELKQEIQSIVQRFDNLKHHRCENCEKKYLPQLEKDIKSLKQKIIIKQNYLQKITEHATRSQNVSMQQSSPEKSCTKFCVTDRVSFNEKSLTQSPCKSPNLYAQNPVIKNMITSYIDQKEQEKINLNNSQNLQ